MLAAQCFIRDWDAAFARIQEHSNYWTPDRIEAEWDGYVISARKLIDFALDRIDREEAELYPYADNDVTLAERAPDDRNWAGSGLELRDRIHRSAA
jgi:hypothetical protein